MDNADRKIQKVRSKWIVSKIEKGQRVYDKEFKTKKLAQLYIEFKEGKKGNA